MMVASLQLPDGVVLQRAICFLVVTFSFLADPTNGQSDLSPNASIFGTASSDAVVDWVEEPFSTRTIRPWTKAS